jgi:arylsulfatase A-like enzyme
VIGEDKPDFVFLYMVETDEKGGHDNGWMSEEYLRRVSIGIDNVKRVIDAYGEEYSVIIMADHGGHGRSHGTTLPEDMTVPFFFRGEAFEKGKEIDGVSLLEIAPTIAALMGIAPEPDWEGHSVI